MDERRAGRHLVAAGWRAQIRFQAASISTFDLLAAVGYDCAGIEARPLSDQEIGQRLRAVTAATAPGSLGPTASDELRLSVAGAQLEITSRRMLITRSPAAVASVQA